MTRLAPLAGALAVAVIAHAAIAAPARDVPPDGEAAHRPIVPAMTLIGDGSFAASGTESRRTAGRVFVAAGVTLDLDSALGWRGTRAYVGGIALRGRNGNELAGELQPHSNIDAAPFEEAIAWLEASTGGERFRVRAGRMDANEEFACAASGASFLNSSAGLNPILERLPTYPSPKIGIHAIANASPTWQVAGGVHDLGRDPGETGDRTFAIGEVRRNWRSSRSSGRAAVGGWRRGAYALVEQNWNPASAIGEVRAFAQFGHAPSGPSVLDGHIAAGVVVEGRGRRAGHASGALVSWASIRAPAPGSDDVETVVELFHRIRVLPSLAIQPDLQHIVGPSGNRARDRRWVATVRVELSF